MPEISATALDQLRSSLVKFNEELEPLPRIFDGTNDLVAPFYKPDEHSVRAIRRYLDDLSWTGDADQFGSRLQSLQGAIFELYRVRAGLPGAKRVTRRNLPGATLPRFRSDAAFNEAFIFSQMCLGREVGNFRRFISGLIERLNQYVRARVIHGVDFYRKLGVLPLASLPTKRSGKRSVKWAKRTELTPHAKEVLRTDSDSGRNTAEAGLPKPTEKLGSRKNSQGSDNGASMTQKIEVKDSPGTTVNQIIGWSNCVSQVRAKRDDHSTRYASVPQSVCARLRESIAGQVIASLLVIAIVALVIMKWPWIREFLG